MAKNLSFVKYIIFIILYLVLLDNINCITKDSLKNLDDKFDENVFLNDIKKINADFYNFSNNVDKVIEQEKKELKNKNYDKKEYRKKYRNFFDECEIFYEYYTKQRKRLSDFINKPTGKISQELIDAQKVILGYVFDSKNLVKDLGEKTFIDKEEL